LCCLVPVFDEENPNVGGSICELADNGLTITGIVTKTGERKKLLVACEDFFQVDSFSLEAKCVWFKWDEAAKAYLAAFEIVRLTEQARRNLTELVRLVKLPSV
jgi:hypothetical protein